VAKSVFDAPQFKTEEGAFAYVEAHLWPNGPVCPHCGNCAEDRIRKMQGKTTRMGLYKCNECRKPFTVRMGTIFESSHLALHLWLQVIHLMSASKKGISTRQIQRMLQCSMKTAWFLTHRIREAMGTDDLSMLGGEGSTVEIDETFIGIKEGHEKARRAYHHKMKVLSLVDRNSGQSRSFVVEGTGPKHLLPIVMANVDKASAVMTDQWHAYRNLGADFARHGKVHHDVGEYVRGDVYTNTVEGFFSVFKRGMRGIYQHCRERYLHRYLVEFDFRYSNRSALGIEDTERSELLLKGFVGKRLTYATVSVGE
jgi:transposase-like protein